MPSPRSSTARLSIALAVSSALVACASTQRVAGPLWLDGEPGAAPDARGRTEVTVVRHSSPVEVRRPGAPAGYRLPYYAKRARLLPGGEVWVGPAGRAELVWENEASSVVVFGVGRVTVGDPELDQPLVSLGRLTRVQLVLAGESFVVLPGGAELAGDPVRTSGPFLVESTAEGLVRVRNQSKEEALISYRDARLSLAPGDSIDLAILASGTAPFDRDPDWARTAVGDYLIETLGPLEPILEGDSLRVQAAGPGKLAALGVQVRLETGDAVILSRPGGKRSAASRR